MQTQQRAPAQGKVLPWSYSSLQAFETCPRRFYLTRITKQVRESQSAEMAYGSAVHKALEHAVGGTAPLPAKFTSYQPLVDRLLAAPGEKQTERRFALTSSFQPTTFFANDAWVRGVIDLALLRAKSATVLDYKTGKPKHDGDQLKLFAAVAFADYPYVQTVQTGYVWLAHDKVDTARFEREDVPSIWQDFLPRIQRMEHSAATGDFPPRPSGLCRQWCPVGRRLCEFCGTD